MATLTHKKKDQKVDWKEPILGLGYLEINTTFEDLNIGRSEHSKIVQHWNIGTFKDLGI